MNFHELCTPAKIYLVLVIIYFILDCILVLLGEMKFNLNELFTLIFGLIMSYLMNMLCIYNWKTLAWIILILQFIAPLVVMLYLITYKKDK